MYVFPTHVTSYLQGTYIALLKHNSLCGPKNIIIYPTPTQLNHTRFISFNCYLFRIKHILIILLFNTVSELRVFFVGMY